MSLCFPHPLTHTLSFLTSPAQKPCAPVNITAIPILHTPRKLLQTYFLKFFFCLFVFVPVPVSNVPTPMGGKAVCQLCDVKIVSGLDHKWKISCLHGTKSSPWVDFMGCTAELAHRSHWRATTHCSASERKQFPDPSSHSTSAWVLNLT